VTDQLSQRDLELIEIGRTAELVKSVKTAVREEVNSLVPELVRASVRKEVKESMQSYFGHRAPEHILEVISATEKFHSKLEKFRSTFWSRLLKGVLTWILYGCAMFALYKVAPQFFKMSIPDAINPAA
jgi:hypothetical protein